MTTATRPIPAHGTYARANGSPGYREPCHCGPCRTIRRRRDKQARVRRELGHSPFTDPAASRAHLQLVHTRMSWDSISAATGIRVSNLVLIYSGQRKKIFNETHQKIMRVALPEQADPGRHLNAIGSMRRIQALQTVGHSIRTIAAEAGSARTRILSIVHGRQPTVQADLASRIALAYRNLAFQPPPRNKYTARTRNAAAAAGWHGPLAWDNIDDPNAMPEAPEPQDHARRRPEPVDVARVTRLTRQGLTAEEIARVLDCTKRTVVRARGRQRSLSAVTGTEAA